MDGLPGMHRAVKAGKTYKVAPIKKTVGPLAPTKYRHGYGFSMLQVMLIALLSLLAGLAIANYGRAGLEFALKSLQSQPLEINMGNSTNVPSLDGLAGLWSTK